MVNVYGFSVEDVTGDKLDSTQTINHSKTKHKLLNEATYEEDIYIALFYFQSCISKSVACSISQCWRDYV